MQRVSSLIHSALFGLLISSVVSLAHAETHIVEMLKYKFVPEEITIKAGDTVHWVNVERRAYHTIWFKEQSKGKKKR